MRRCDVDSLDPTLAYWVPAVVAPSRSWQGAQGSHRGSRFLVDSQTLEASRDEFETFESESRCLEWIMLHRSQLNRNFPGVPVKAVRLDLWLLGLS
jgi:hypothetical protein